MKITKRPGPKSFVLMMSILSVGMGTLSAQGKEPGPFEKFFRSLQHAFNEPEHKSTTHRTKHKQTQDTASPTANEDKEPDVHTGTGTISKPPNETNTRSTSRAVTKRGEDLPYGTPVPGRQGFVTSPFSPNSGYIDVRGFAPGTPVKDPYTGKVFLTP
ncbi:MAG TPA: hypothetical protein VNX27_11590 [Chthoniobacterales bacterium]|jgi:hypothetical protein|nr:hypothetical protein [Chthoniobacterales bacterium]